MRRAVVETKRVVSVILCRSVIAKLEEDGYAYTFLLDKHGSLRTRCRLFVLLFVLIRRAAPLVTIL